MCVCVCAYPVHIAFLCAFFSAIIRVYALLFIQSGTPINVRDETRRSGSAKERKRGWDGDLIQQNKWRKKMISPTYTIDFKHLFVLAALKKKNEQKNHSLRIWCVADVHRIATAYTKQLTLCFIAHAPMSQCNARDKKKDWNNCELALCANVMRLARLLFIRCCCCWINWI